MQRRTILNRAKASKIINLENKGIGPVDSISLNNSIDINLVNIGKSIYHKECIACHKLGKTFIGPPPNGILERRSPEWVMNMIVNPEEMLQKDSIAQALFMEYDGQLMTDQRITITEARAILEYFKNPAKARLGICLLLVIYAFFIPI